MRLPRKMKKKLKAAGKDWKYFRQDTQKKLQREIHLDILYPGTVPSLTENLSDLKVE